MTRMTRVQRDKGKGTPLANSQLTSFVIAAHSVPAKGIHDFGVPEDSSCFKKKNSQASKCKRLNWGTGSYVDIPGNPVAMQPTPWNFILGKHEAFCDYFTQAKDIPPHSLKKEFFKRLSSFLGQLLLSKGLLDASHRPSQSLSLLTCELKTTGSTSQRNYGIEGGDTVIVPSMRVLSWSPSHSTGWISMDHHTR